ncbi:hypothetical protein ACU635_27275 [[Actinomadura] parvosata]|uniref:hypothetical protein n=1 Tax=[Actinomadura] parvosata TaxID=1955412 RepID=UPI00406D3606
MALVWACFFVAVGVSVVSRLHGRLLLGFGARPGLARELGHGFLIVSAAMVALFGGLVAVGGTTVAGVGLRADVLGNGLAAFLSWAVLEEVPSRMGLLPALLALTRRPWGRSRSARSRSARCTCFALHDNGPEWLAGGTYGPEGGILSLLDRVLIIVMVLATTRHAAHPLLLSTRAGRGAPATTAPSPL